MEEDDEFSTATMTVLGLLKLGDVSTPTLNELIEDTNDINTGNIADMMAGTARDTFGDTDIIQGINNVVGTSSSDVLIGSSGDDELTGGRGDDFVMVKPDLML